MAIGTRPFKGKVKYLEIKQTTTGKQRYSFKLTQGKKLSDGSWQNEDWNASSFIPVAEGEKIEVTEFSLEQKKYTDRNNVQRIAYNMTIWKINREESQEIRPQNGNSSAMTFDDISDDDPLPF